MNIINNQISIGNVPLTQLAETYGTPFYVYDEQRIRANFRRCYDSYKKYYDNVRIYYAIKCNGNTNILKILRSEGAWMDAAAPSELHLAKEIGVPGNEMIFSGNYSSEEDLQYALDVGAIINLDDISLLPKLLKLGKPEVLSFRINPGVGKSNVGDKVVTAGPNAKFGVPLEQAEEAYRAAKEAGITRFGVHMMTGSCVLEPEYFAMITEKLMDIVGPLKAKLGIDFEFVDIGGGLGIPYTPDEQPLDMEETAKQVSAVFKAKIEEYNLEAPALVMEPGRYLVGDAGFLVGRVHAIKDAYKKFVGIDAGMNCLIRPAMYDAYHHMRVDGRPENENLEKVNICGQICENSDIFAKDRMMPKAEVGDLICIENAGAYSYGMSFQYNGRVKPAEVLVNGDQHALIRERETWEEFTRLVREPEWLR